MTLRGPVKALAPDFCFALLRLLRTGSAYKKAGFLHCTAKFACGARAFLARVLLNSLFGRTGLNIYQSKYSIVSPDEGLKLKTNILYYTVFVGRYISFP